MHKAAMIIKLSLPAYRFSSLFNSSSNKSKTYYEILDVPTNASKKMIRNNFLKKGIQINYIYSKAIPSRS